MNKNFKLNKDNGFLIIIVSSLILIIIFVLYGLSKKQKQTEKFAPEIERIEKVSPSNSLEDIEKDLAETDLDKIDFEIEEIEAELESASNEF